MSAASLGSRAIIGAFFERLHASTGLSWLDEVALRSTATRRSRPIKWLGQVPAMREWVGGRNAKAFRDNGFTIANLKFEATIQVTLDEIRRDKTGQVMAASTSSPTARGRTRRR
jgi:phage major head subunit gpT-like protein